MRILLTFFLFSAEVFTGGFVAAQDQASGVSDTVPSDPEIGRAIREDLGDFPVLEDAEIDVVVEAGVVTLSGKVDNLLAKRRAARVGKRTRGVMAVDNQLVVRPSDKSDEGLAREAEAALADEEALDRDRIAISVTGGTVAITGKVRSLAEKRLAEQTVAAARGVQNVDNQLVVSLAAAEDPEQIEAEIESLLTRSVYLDGADLSVSVSDDNVAFITGDVSSQMQREIARRKAGVRGIEKVDVSGIEIDPNRNRSMLRQQRYQGLDEEETERAIRTAMRADPLVFAYLGQIEINVDDGIARLSGRVGRVRAKQSAEQDARNTVGVWKVINAIEVQWSEGGPTDEEIIDNVQAAFLRSANLTRSDLRVHSRQAHVSLYGMVETPFEKKYAGWIAGGLPGVLHVANHVSVKPDSRESKPDKVLEEAIREKWRHAFFDNSSNLRVEVEDGVAVLSGEVDTWRQWQTAMDLAVEAGAREPHNLIDVRLHPPHGGSNVFVP